MALECSFDIPGFCYRSALREPVNAIDLPMYREEPNAECARCEHEGMSLHHPPP
jgi:hypothetical protein